MAILHASVDVDVHTALHSSRDAVEAIEALEELTFLQHCSDSVRKFRLEHQRLQWEEHAHKLQHEESFVNEYTMSYDAHKELCDILRDHLQRKEFNSRSLEPIAVEHIIAAGLRTLQGGRVKDARHIIGASRAAAYVCFDDFIDAVLDAPQLEIKMPQNDAEWRAVNEGFAQRSTHRVMSGCVGAFDGFFQRSNKPSNKEVTNITSYYNGHYESFGLNNLALVKADLQFMYFAVVTPGSTNDFTSYRIAKGLKEIAESLPLGLYFVADAAFPLSEHVLIPFFGSQRFASVANDAFNYYLSQM